MENTKSGSIGFCGLLTIVFIVLKLCHVIDWSWIWILSPLWILPLFGISILILLGFIGIVLLIIKSI